MVRSHTLRLPPAGRPQTVHADASLRADARCRIVPRTLSCAALVLLVCLGGCAASQPQGASEVAPAEERVKAYLDLAEGYLNLGDLNRARLPVERALEVDARSWAAHDLLGRIYQREGETELAERHFRLAVRYGPDVARVRNDYGVFLYEEGRYDEAVDQLRRAVADPTNPQRAVAYQNLGLATLQSGGRTEARNAFARAVMLDEKMATSMLELAELAWEDADYSQSAAWYQRFRNLSRQNARSLWLGVRLARLADDEDAEASYALQLRNLFPLSPEYRLLQDSRGARDADGARSEG